MAVDIVWYNTKEMKNVLSLLVFSLMSAASAADGGWRDVCPDRTLPTPAKAFGCVPLDRGASSVEVEWRDGGEGTVEFVRRNGRPALKVTKRNETGYALVRSRAPIPVPAGSRLRAFAGCEAESAEPEYAIGFLGMYAGKEDLSYFPKFSVNGRGGPKQTLLACTPPGMRDRKLCHYEVGSDETNVVLTIVIAGRPSVSWWTDWGLEDFTAAEKAWKASSARRTARAPAKSAPPEAADAAEHTAKVVREDGVAKLRIDGRDTVPVLFKYSSGAFAAKGFEPTLFGELQVVGVRFGATRRPGQGFWTKDGFDVAGAVGRIRAGLARTPSSKVILSVGLDAYPEFADEHPDETWVDVDGRKVFGDAGHTPWTLPKEMNPKSQWHWVSIHSLVWRDAVKAHLAALVGELRRTGLAKRIVGVHLTGFHDAQFATGRPDYSKPALAAFRRWQERRYGAVKWADAPKPDPAQTFFRPDREPALVDYVTFGKQEPFAVQEDLARHVKGLFGKDVFVIRYCMGPFGGSYNAAYDITPFVRSDAIDVLCAQPDYGRRVPGVAVAHRLPLESFHRHGKLFLNEFDLRTYGASTPWEGELATMTYSRATDFPMWCSVNRKLAGQMFAKRMGWWYLDMAGGWFDPPEIRADIDATVAVGKDLAVRPADPWRSDVAVVTDEEGLLLRNTLARYYNADEQLQNGAQMQVLGGCGVPLDSWLLDDWLEDPSLADRYRTVVFQGLYHLDTRRLTLIRRLSADGRTLVFLTGTGLAGGVEKLGLSVTERAPASNETVAADGVKENVASLMHEGRVTATLGLSAQDWRVRQRSPRRFEIAEGKGLKVLARYADGGQPALVARSGRAFTWVYVGSYGGLTPDLLHRLAKDSGAYVPTDRPGLEVDMNGDFVSLHCIRPGAYTFALPYAGLVRNLKTGAADPQPKKALSLDLTAGETRWYGLSRPHAESGRTERALFRAAAADPARAVSAIAAGLESPDDFIRRAALCELFERDRTRAFAAAEREIPRATKVTGRFLVEMSRALTNDARRAAFLAKLSEGAKDPAVREMVAADLGARFRRENVAKSQDPTLDREYTLMASFDLPADGWAFAPETGKPFHARPVPAYAPAFDDSAWKRISVGNVWEKQGFPGFNGIGWYRVRFTLPERPTALASAELCFDGVDEEAWVWLNGTFLGQHTEGPTGWDMPFRFGADAELVWGGENLLVVRVKDSADAGGIWKCVRVEALK